MMIKAKKLGLRFIVSLASGVSTAFVVFIGCYAILMIVKEKRIADIKRHSENLAVQISELPSIRSYLLEAPGAPKKGEIENRLKILLGSDPFIEEITVIDRFQKMLFCIAQPRDELRDDPIERASISLHEVISGGQPIADERNLEYFIPLSLTSDTASGMLRVHWKPEAVVNFYQVLKVGIFYVAAGSFILAFLMSKTEPVP